MPRGAARARRPHRASDHAGPLARTRSQLVGKVAQPKCSPAKMVLQSYIDACMVRYVCAVLHLSIVGVPVLNTTAGTSGRETSALDIELSTTASQDGAVTQLCRSYHRPCPSLPSFVVVLTGIPAVNCGATRNIFCKTKKKDLALTPRVDPASVFRNRRTLPFLPVDASEQQ